MIIVVSCTEKKTAGNVPAFDKYVARQHKLVRDNLEDLWAAGHTVYILSAKFGLVPAQRALPDYDLKMTVDRGVELGKQVRAELALATEEDDGEIVVYGSAIYRAVIEAATDRPVNGLVGADRGCGDHYSALKKFLEDFLV